MSLAAMKLGRHAPTAAQRRLSIPLRDVLRKPLPPGPPSYEGVRNAPLLMGHNDTVGDCVFVSMGNTDAVRSVLEHRDPVCTDDGLRDAYFKWTGGEDVGANEGEVYRAAAQDGFVLGAVGSAPWKLANGTLTIPVDDLETRKSVIAMLGSVALGLNLPLSAQDGGTWDLPAGPLTGRNTPGSWGGHAALQGSYREDGGLDILTWKTWQLATERFMQGVCDEVHVLPDALLVLSPYVDYDAVMAALAALAART